MTEPKELDDRELDQLAERIDAALVTVRDVKKVCLSITRKLKSRRKGGLFIPRSAVKDEWIEQFRKIIPLTEAELDEVGIGKYFRDPFDGWERGGCHYCRGTSAQFRIVIPTVVYGKLFLKKHLICSKHGK